LLVLEGEVFSPGSSHCGLIHRHNSSVGVSHETTIGNSGGSTGIDSAIDSLGEEVVSAGSSNSRSVNRHNSSVRVGNKASKGGRGGSVGNRGSSNSWGSSIGNSWGSSIGNSWGSSNNGSLSSIDSSLGGEVISTSSSNSRLINRGDSTIGVSNQLGVEVQGSRVAIGRGISSWGSSIGNSWGSSIGGNSWGSSSIVEWAGNSQRCSSIELSLGSEVLSLGSGDSWLIHGGDGSVGVANQPVETLGGDAGQGSSKNQKLHDETC